MEGAETNQPPRIKPDKSWVAKKWSGMDRRFFKPLLTHSHPTLLDTLPTRCLGLGRILTSSEQLMHHPMMKKVETADTETLHLADSSQVVFNTVIIR